ncbi:MAG: helix-turn-helix domain-containing protein [Psychrosphaera sp.]|nr:helix-turn-helix domain-containing protein [Psychrosphaera sp.]
MTNYIYVQIIDYANSLKTAVHGLNELFFIANQKAQELGQAIEFVVDIQEVSALPSAHQGNRQVIIVPTSLEGEYYLAPQSRLIDYLNHAHKNGAVLCSACAGTFILADTGLLNQRQVTTHWQLANVFADKYPEVVLSVDKILINDADIITAGGLMSWLDLGLEIVAQYMKPTVMRALGKYLIVDTGKREQRYYQSFNPRFDHGAEQILTIQHFIQANHNRQLTVEALAQRVFMTKRTFLRQFSAATKHTPVQYIQRVRVQKACELLETTNKTTEQIAALVGYDDVNGFRKVFNKVVGLNPTGFRAKFVG